MLRLLRIHFFKTDTVILFHVDGYSIITCFQATGSNTTDACLQDQDHLHAASLKLHPFRPSFKVTSPQNHVTEGDRRILPARSMTLAPSKISKCRKRMPLDAHWSHAMGLKGVLQRILGENICNE